MTQIISLHRIRLSDAYSVIKPKTLLKIHIINRYCEGRLQPAEVAYLFAKHKLAGE